MTTEQFAYWLKGFLEIENPTTLDKRKTQIVKDHLELVFKKETPNRDFNSPPEEPTSFVVEHNRGTGGNPVICCTDNVYRLPKGYYC